MRRVNIQALQMLALIPFGVARVHDFPRSDLNSMRDQALTILSVPCRKGLGQRGSSSKKWCSRLLGREEIHIHSSKY